MGQPSMLNQGVDDPHAHHIPAIQAREADIDEQLLSGSGVQP
jgi:hypothetical protein